MKLLAIVLLFISINCAYGKVNPPLPLLQKNVQNGVFKSSPDLVIKLNKGIDTVLNFIRETFTSSGELSIPLPNLSRPFGHAPYSGTFKASDGYFKNPASLHRTGDVAIEKNGDSVSLEVALGLSEAEAVFEKYTLDILGIHQAGLINVTVEKNSLMMKITLTYAPACIFKLNYIKFNELSGIKVHITGLGVFQTLFDQLSKWLISNFEDTFRQIVNKKLYEKVNQVVQKKDVCKYFPF